ncbi:MAG: tpaK [Sphingomonas bacterium]|nr:MFS transporter [Sphingomonas bacterium]MDB5688816.1 tpaK [Sphingomonas bacterium]
MESASAMRLPASFIDDRPIRGRQWLTVFLCGLVMFLDGFDTQSISYMAPHIAEEWHLSRALLGPIFSAALVGLMAGYLLLSPLSDRYGHKRMVVWSTLAFGIATLLCLLAQDVTSLMVLRFLTGVGLGAATPSAVALTGEYSPKKWRASFVLAIYCGFSLGFVVAGLVSGWIIPTYGWRSMFWVGGIVPLLLTPVLLIYLPEALSTITRPGADRAVALAHLRRLDPSFRDEELVAGEIADPRAGRRKAPLRAIFSDGMAMGTLLLWGVFLINLGAFYAMQSWMPTILTDLGHPLSTGVAATSLVTVGGMVAAFIVGPAMDRISPYNALAILYALGFLFVAGVGIMLRSSTAMLLAATFLAGLCVSGGQKSVIALAAVFYRAEVRSTGVGWALGIGRLGGIAGPLIIGWALTSGLAPQNVFYLLAVPMLIMALTVVIMGRRYGSAAPAVEAHA